MTSIPVLQERFIPQVSSKPSSVGVFQSATDFLATAGQVGMQYKQAKDATKVTEEYSRFQVDMQNEQENLKNTIDNSSDFTNEWNTIYQTKKNEYLNNPQLSGRARNILESSFSKYRADSSLGVAKTQRQLETVEYANSVEETARNNNIVAYRAGENLDLNSLNNAEQSLKANIIAGSTLVSQDKLEESARVQTQNLYSNFIKGVAGTDIEHAKQLVNDKNIQDKLVDVETIDRMKTYIRQVENRQEQLEKDALADEKSLKKASLDVNKQIALEAEFNKFNIGQKKGRDIVKNKEFNSMTDIVSFRNDVKEAKSLNQITDKEYQKYISDTTPVMINMIQKGKGKTQRFFYDDVNEQLADDIKKQFKDNPAVSDSDLTGIYEETYNQLAQENIDLTSTNTNDKLKAQELLQNNIRNFSALATGHMDTNATIIGNSIVPLNEEATTKGSQLDNGGFKLEQDSNGNRAWVRRDGTGTVLEVKEVR